MTALRVEGYENGADAAVVSSECLCAQRQEPLRSRPTLKRTTFLRWRAAFSTVTRPSRFGIHRRLVWAMSGPPEGDEGEIGWRDEDKTKSVVSST